MIIGKRYIKAYILGGWSEFSIENLQTGNKFHYRIQAAEDKAGMYFIRIITGLGATYAGMVVEDKETHKYKYIKGTKGTKTEEETVIKALMYVIEHTDNMASSVIVQSNGRCSSCGKYIDKQNIDETRQGKCKDHIQEIL